MDELARLKWQCRRGTKELDFLLNRYLETGYLTANHEEKEKFMVLLGLEDDELAGLLLGERCVGKMGFLVEKIRCSCIS